MTGFDITEGFDSSNLELICKEILNVNNICLMHADKFPPKNKNITILMNLKLYVFIISAKVMSLF